MEISNFDEYKYVFNPGRDLVKEGWQHWPDLRLYRHEIELIGGMVHDKVQEDVLWAMIIC